MVQMPPSSETPVLLSSRGKPSKLPVLVDRITNPVDPWVITDGGMGWIDQYNFEVLVSRVLQWNQWLTV